MPSQGGGRICLRAGDAGAGVSQTEDLNSYVQREVLPHVPDAWIDHEKTKIGYEIPFNRISRLIPQWTLHGREFEPALGAAVNSAPFRIPVESDLVKFWMRGGFRPRCFTWDAEHRRHRVIAEGDYGLWMFPARARDADEAVDECVETAGGVCHRIPRKPQERNPQDDGRLRKGDAVSIGGYPVFGSGHSSRRFTRPRVAAGRAAPRQQDRIGLHRRFQFDRRERLVLMRRRIAADPERSLATTGVLLVCPACGHQWKARQPEIEAAVTGERLPSHRDRVRLLRGIGWVQHAGQHAAPRFHRGPDPIRWTGWLSWSALSRSSQCLLQCS